MLSGSCCCLKKIFLNKSLIILVFFSTILFIIHTELRKTLQKQEEQTKEREKNIDELQNKNESLKSDLAKADKERKELAHKVGLYVFFTDGGDKQAEWDNYRGGLEDERSFNAWLAW